MFCLQYMSRDDGTWPPRDQCWPIKAQQLISFKTSGSITILSGLSWKHVTPRGISRDLDRPIRFFSSKSRALVAFQTIGLLIWTKIMWLFIWVSHVTVIYQSDGDYCAPVVFQTIGLLFKNSQVTYSWSNQKVAMPMIKATAWIFTWQPSLLLVYQPIHYYVGNQVFSLQHLSRYEDTWHPRDQW